MESSFRIFRRGVRVAEWARLESVCTSQYRGFESLSLRQWKVPIYWGLFLLVEKRGWEHRFEQVSIANKDDPQDRVNAMNGQSLSLRQIRNLFVVMEWSRTREEGLSSDEGAKTKQSFEWAGGIDISGYKVQVNRKLWGIMKLFAKTRRAIILGTLLAITGVCQENIPGKSPTLKLSNIALGSPP